MNLGLCNEEWVNYQVNMDKYRRALASCQIHGVAKGHEWYAPEPHFFKNNNAPLTK